MAASGVQTAAAARKKAAESNDPDAIRELEELEAKQQQMREAAEAAQQEALAKKDSVKAAVEAARLQQQRDRKAAELKKREKEAKERALREEEAAAAARAKMELDLNAELDEGSTPAPDLTSETTAKKKFDVFAPSISWKVHTVEVKGGLAIITTSKSHHFKTMQVITLRSVGAAFDGTFEVVRIDGKKTFAVTAINQPDMEPKPVAGFAEIYVIDQAIFLYLGAYFHELWSSELAEVVYKAPPLPESELTLISAQVFEALVADLVNCALPRFCKDEFDAVAATEAVDLTKARGRPLASNPGDDIFDDVDGNSSADPQLTPLSGIGSTSSFGRGPSLDPFGDTGKLDESPFRGSSASDPFGTPARSGRRQSVNPFDDVFADEDCSYTMDHVNPFFGEGNAFEGGDRDDEDGEGRLQANGTEHGHDQMKHMQVNFGDGVVSENLQTTSYWSLAKECLRECADEERRYAKAEAERRKQMSDEAIELEDQMKKEALEREKAVSKNHVFTSSACN